MKCKFTKCFIFLIVFLLHSGFISAEDDYSEKIIPEIKLEKSKYTLGEAVRFWIGAKTKDGSSIAWPQCTLYITRPDGIVKSITTEQMDGMRYSSSFQGGSGLREDPQLGKYLLVFEILGQKTDPVELCIEDLGLSNLAKAEFVINSSKKYAINEKIPFELRVANKSNEVIKFHALGSFGAPLSVFIKDEKGATSAVFYPYDRLIDSQFKDGNYSIVKDIYDWEAAKFVPTIILNPGEVYKKDLWLNDVDQFSSSSPGVYKVTLSAVLEMLIGEKGGKYNDFCPVRLPVKSVVDIEIR